MSKNKTILGVVILVIFLIGCVYIILNNSKTVVTQTTQIPVQNNASTTIITKQYTMADIAKHADATSCWSTVDGKVYDLTAWIDQHPGGSGAILSMCGVDGSSAFNDKHGGQRRPANELAGFIIGDLKN